MNAFSEEEEDEPYCSSGEEWNGKEQRKKVKRRVSNRVISKKAKLETINDSSEDDEIELESKSRVKKRNDKREILEGEENEHLTSSRNPFSSGSYVISKLDAKNYDPNTPPYIWRIDGKALLQKFEPYIENGWTNYKNTSVYSGWSPVECNKYTPIKDIIILQNTHQKIHLTFNFDQLKNVDIDSE